MHNSALSARVRHDDPRWTIERMTGTIGRSRIAGRSLRIAKDTGPRASAMKKYNPRHDDRRDEGRGGDRRTGDRYDRRQDGGRSERRGGDRFERRRGPRTRP